MCEKDNPPEYYDRSLGTHPPSPSPSHSLVPVRPCLSPFILLSLFATPLSFCPLLLCVYFLFHSVQCAYLCVLTPVTSLCSLSVDLRKLPKDVITKSSGPGGEYYRVDYDLGITFSAGGIEFRFLHEGKVMGFVDADYY